IPRPCISCSEHRCHSTIGGHVSNALKILVLAGLLGCDTLDPAPERPAEAQELLELPVCDCTTTQDWCWFGTHCHVIPCQGAGHLCGIYHNVPCNGVCGQGN